MLLVKLMHLNVMYLKYQLASNTAALGLGGHHPLNNSDNSLFCDRGLRHV